VLAVGLLQLSFAPLAQTSSSGTGCDVIVELFCMRVSATVSELASNAMRLPLPVWILISNKKIPGEIHLLEH